MSPKQDRKRYIEALLNHPSGSESRVIAEQFTRLKTWDERLGFLDHLIATYAPTSREHEIACELRELATGAPA